MRSTILVFCLVLTIVAVSLEPSHVHADVELARPTKLEAKEHLATGNRLYRVREFEKAIEEYKAGVLKEDVPLFGYNLAQCYRQLGRYEEAIWHYERFMSRAQPTGEMKTAIEGFLTQMKDELEKRTMNKPPVEPAPERRVPPLSTAPIPKVEATIERQAPWYRDRVGWAVSGTGVVGVGVALGLFVSAKGLNDNANPLSDQREREALRERASDRRLIGAIVGVLGGAALATGVVKLAIYPRGRERGVTSALDISVTRNGFSLNGRF